MAYRRAFAHNVRPYNVPPQTTAQPTYRRPGDRSGVGFAAEPALGSQPRDRPRDEDDRNTLSTSQAIAAPSQPRQPSQPKQPSQHSRGSPYRGSPYRAPPAPSPTFAAAEAAAAAVVSATPAVPAASCASCGRGRDVRHACTWSVQVGEVPISYVSHDDWGQQARPERGAAPDSVPEPFRGCTLEDRHPHEPRAGYSDAERERLCPSCGTLVVHWETHAAGSLHQARAPAPVPSPMDVVAALQVLQAARPDLMAAPLAAASPEALLAAARSEAQPDGRPDQPRPSRWGPKGAWTAPPT